MHRRRAECHSPTCRRDLPLIGLRLTKVFSWSGFPKERNRPSGIPRNSYGKLACYWPSWYERLVPFWLNDRNEANAGRVCLPYAPALGRVSLTMGLVRFGHNKMRRGPPCMRWGASPGLVTDHHRSLGGLPSLGLRQVRLLARSAGCPTAPVPRSHLPAQGLPFAVRVLLGSRRAWR